VRKELLIKGRSLTGTSDLTLLAPIKPGLVSSLDSITYKSRVQRLLKTLQGGRTSLHEYSSYRPLSDAVERVAVIQSFRVAVLEPEDKVLLAVTFDGTWESYIRILWQKVGTLLDIIFCNTEGYVISTASFEAWADWVRRVQVETGFFYTTHGLTVDDVAYLREEERIHRLPPDGSSQDLAAVRHRVHSAESIAFAAAIPPGPPSPQGMLATVETLRQGLQSLAVLFRLTDTYQPGTPDGDVLWRASRDLLQEFIVVAYNPALPAPVVTRMRQRFARQLDWLAAVPPPRVLPKLPDAVDRKALADVQAGILWPYGTVTHGCLVMIALDDPVAAASLLDQLIAMTTTEGNQPQNPGLRVNVSVTYEGLRACGLTEAQLALFPQEFREGMEARASVLGDFRTNHPRRWRMPQRNWNAPAGAGRIELSAVHLLVQLRTASPATQIDPTQPTHPLHAVIGQIASGPDGKPRPGVRILHVQGMYRQLRGSKIVEHFGFVDGESDPVFDKGDEGTAYPNRVPVGEFILGRDNEVDAAPVPATPQEQERLDWLLDGSFLVVRKLSQHVDRLHNVLVAATRQTGLARDEILTRMMGRYPDGRAAVAPTAPKINDFHYRGDPDGSLCPFHAHIRRANPRIDPAHPVDPPALPLGGRQPRLMRRGMSYGAPYQLPTDLTQPAQPDGVERGLVFMAYNASISEQFEVVQRWISGGNSAGGHSRQSDPFLGVPDWNEARGYRFEAQGQPHRIALDAAPALYAEPQPLVRLEWGMYAFTPSLRTLARLRNVAASAAAVAPVWSVEQGEAALLALLQREQQLGPAQSIVAWKALLEDPEAQEKYRAAGVWAAIRARHGGVLRTAYGVLVADAALADQVLRDQQHHFSVGGYRERMLQSIGEIFLGLDAGPDGEYARQSKVANEAISKLTLREAFDLTLSLTRQALTDFINVEKTGAAQLGLQRWELNLDAKEVVDQVLARLCQEWFGLPQAGGTLVPGSWRWDWQEPQPPIYPAHFTAPSRYIFQPHPGADVEDFGQRIGRALTSALTRFIVPHRMAGTVPQTPGAVGLPARDAPLAKAILAAFPGRQNDALVGRIMCGALMGFLPTVDGNFRLSLNELLRDGSFWSLRAAWAVHPKANLFDRAVDLLRGPLVRAMQLRPSPELVWRRVTGDGVRIGGVELRAGEMVVLALVSAAQQQLAAGSPDVSMVFGGERSGGSGPHPTHACPGYQAGMGILLGLMTGFIAVAEQMRPSPVPLAFTFEG
jgi:deferrochelatase/peroxidase EfeB